MKTLKLSIVLCTVALFSLTTINAQTERGTGSAIWHFEGIWLSDCVGETLTGDIEYYTYAMWQGDATTWLNWQDRYYGTFVGDITGDIYIFIEVDRYHNVLNQNAGNFYFNGRWSVIRKGQGLIGIAHTLVHGTANDATWNTKEGNFASWVEFTHFECK